MIGDQPDPYSPPSTHTSSDKEFFKVQRSPNGKLSLVYNDDYIMQKGTDSASLSGSNENINCKYLFFFYFFFFFMMTTNLILKMRIQFQFAANNRDNVENHFHTPFSGGLSLTKVSETLHMYILMAFIS